MIRLWRIFLICSGQSYEDGVGAEFEEEVGYKIGELRFIGEMAPSKGQINEMMKIFLVKKLEKTKSHPDETEEIEILFKTSEEIDKMVENNEIWCGETIAAWSLAIKYFK